MWTILLVILAIVSMCYGEPAVLILARGGSKEIRLKNLQPVGGISLLRRAIQTAQRAGFHDVTVSTDHPFIALEAIHSRAAIFRRSPVTATDWAPSIWAAAEFMSSRPDVDVLVLMQTTSPFTRPEHIRQALRKLPAYDCVFSVSRSYKLRWRIGTADLSIPINFSFDARPRRQDWSGEFIETGAFYISRKFLIEAGRFQNNKFPATNKKRNPFRIIVLSDCRFASFTADLLRIY